MSMILRLQREKAEAQMEFRQFKRFAESKMSHDQDEIAALEDLIFKKDQAIQSLSCEIQAYKHRLLSVVGYAPSSEPQTPEATPTPSASAFAAAVFDYPPLKCKVVPNAEDDYLDNADDFGETPRDRIQNIEQRITRMERMPSSSHDKGVIGYSPRRPWHLRTMSVDSYGSFPLPVVDRGCDRDDASDRVYTVDAVHAAPDDYINTPREGNGRGGGVDDEEIKRLYMRMQALEADRESMRQTIVSMRTDKAQIVLLKEIAQQMCKEVAPLEQQKKIVKKSSFSFIRCFSIVTAIKWVTSFVFWRKKVSRVKYTFGISNCNAGLLLLLEKSTRMRQRRCLTRTLR
ncbi:myosin-binding protein 7-like [Iris pallida]|nr:myosin-binding protein 7-like [Iris pallida]